MLALQECRPMLPAINLARSLRFYSELGFRAKMLDASVAEVAQDAVRFLIKETTSSNASRPLMVVTVRSLTEWWIKISLLNLPARYEVRAPREPVYETWGEKVGYLHDPSDVTWHFVEGKARSAFRGESATREDDFMFERQGRHHPASTVGSALSA